MTAYSQMADEGLVTAAQAGDRTALERLIIRHRDGLYRFVRRMVWTNQDAEDVTQEVIIKIFTKLATFRGDASFKTWAYRIAVNHTLSMKRKEGERRITSFDNYAEKLTMCPDYPAPGAGDYDVDPLIVLEETKRTCTLGMLLCLDRDQRAAFILGALLDMSSVEAADIMSVSSDAYRQKLSRARKDLRQFMSGNCGLVNPDNSCRCAKKTRAMVEFGVVDAKNLQFNPDHVALASEKVWDISDATGEWLAMFHYQERERAPEVLDSLQNIFVA